MAIYTVLAPPARGDDARADPMATVFVKDGFCWPALFIAPLWMIYRRMWLVLVVYIAATIALSWGLRGLGVGDFDGVVVILLHVLFALEANNLRRWTLERRGYAFAGVAEGRNVEEAEIRFFSRPDGTEPSAAVPVPPVPPTPPAPPTPPMPPAPPRQGPVHPSAEAGDVVGLFPSPASPRGSPS
jgi:hypothetical protein